MNNRFRTYPAYFYMRRLCFFGFVLFAASCGVNDRNSGKPEMARETLEFDYEHGKVVDMRGLDGCTWLIELESGKRLEPINLDEDFRQEGKRVQLTFEPEPEIMSTCMAGEIVRITAIRSAT